MEQSYRWIRLSGLRLVDTPHRPRLDVMRPQSVRRLWYSTTVRLLNFWREVAWILFRSCVCCFSLEGSKSSGRLGILSLSCTRALHQKESRPPWWIAVRKASRSSAAVDVVVWRWVSRLRSEVASSARSEAEVEW